MESKETMLTAGGGYAMIRKYLSGRVVVLIDAANLECSLKQLQWHMDYEKLFKSFSNNADLIEIGYYGPKFATPNHNNFLTKLKKLGYKLSTKDLKKIYNNDGKCINKANFDVEISLDAANLADKYDTLVLFSGDSDFAYLLEILKKRNKKVIVVSSRYHISKELVGRSYKYIELNNLKGMLQRVGV